MSNKKTSWDSFWSKNNTVTRKDVYSLINEVKFDYLRKFVKPNDHSLEVGSGTAHLSAFLAKSGLNTTCLDYSKEALKTAKENYRHQGLNGNFIEGDAFDLPCNESSFDLVFSTGLLEHYEDPFPIIKEMVRVVKPGGVFYSDIVPKKFSLLRAFQRWRRPPRGMDDFYERSMMKEEIEQMLAKANLRDIVVFPAGVYPPELPLIHRSALYRYFEQSFLSRTNKFWQVFDDTKIAEWLGFYYFVYGIK